MNQDSERNSDKQAKCDRPENKWWRKIVMTVALLLLGSAGGGLIYGWYFVQRKLIPLVETEAGNYLHRPLELGELKSIFPTQASFGNSALPVTEDNPDFVKVKEVKINFAPLHFLRQGELKLDIIFVKADVYIERLERYLCDVNVPEYDRAQDNNYDIKPQRDIETIGGWYLGGFKKDNWEIDEYNPE